MPRQLHDISRRTVNSSTMARKRKTKQEGKKEYPKRLAFPISLLVIPFILIPAVITFSTTDIRTFPITSVACITLILLLLANRVSYPPLQALSLVVIIVVSLHCFHYIHNGSPLPWDADEIDGAVITDIDLGVVCGPPPMRRETVSQKLAVHRVMQEGEGIVPIAGEGMDVAVRKLFLRYAGDDGPGSSENDN